MPATYSGSCHCGLVTFEVDGDIRYVVECNCSICRRKGALWHAATDAQLRITQGERELTLYQFNTMTAKHYSCPTCGIAPFSRPRLDPRMWVVNARCVDGIDVDALPRHRFDGEHWEAAAEALRARRG